MVYVIAGWQRVVLDAALSPVQSRLLTCAAGVVAAPVSDRSSYSSSWGGVSVIAGFTECSRRKLLARADDVRYSKTSESGHSEKRTHSLERTKLQVPIENPIFIIHYQPPRSR